MYPQNTENTDLNLKIGILKFPNLIWDVSQQSDKRFEFSPQTPNLKGL